MKASTSHHVLFMTRSHLLNQNLNGITSAYLHSKTRHLHPQTVCKSLQASLGHTVGPHVQAGEEGEDAGGVNHPTCSEAQAQLATN